MNPVTMVRIAVSLLAIAALGGVVMAIVRLFQTMNPHSWLAMLHGLLAAAGITLLLYAAFTAGIPRLANVGVVVLVLAALGGLVLNLKYHSRNALLPRGLMVGHALLAVIGFLLVLLPAWTGW
jgi:glucose uptake protein GlcU